MSGPLSSPQRRLTSDELHDERFLKNVPVYRAQDDEEDQEQILENFDDEGANLLQLGELLVLRDSSTQQWIQDLLSANSITIGRSCVLKKFSSADAPEAGPDTDANEIIAFVHVWTERFRRFSSAAGNDFASKVEVVSQRANFYNATGPTPVLELLRRDRCQRLLVTPFSPIFLFNVILEEKTPEGTNPISLWMLATVLDSYALDHLPSNCDLKRVDRVICLYEGIDILRRICPSLEEVDVLAVDSKQNAELAARLGLVAAESVEAHDLPPSFLSEHFELLTRMRTTDPISYNISEPSTGFPSPLLLPFALFKSDACDETVWVRSHRFDCGLINSPSSSPSRASCRALSPMPRPFSNFLCGI
eukprot:TRINITY_DN6800_c0_g1_i2.p1 TRINITY_DN6800_c0_g1~~TRINITY_DN6800_c0_g1_i2.p1  ORF type:complete len:362 (+),score=32.22 TRINITY_DN6800_c0_g1_i2:38-1123(+)